MKEGEASLLVRMPAERKQALERSAGDRGLSMNQEVNRCIEETLGPLGPDPRTSEFLQILTQAMTLTAEQVSRLIGEGSWLEHPWAYEQVAQAAMYVLEARQPKGPKQSPALSVGLSVARECLAVSQNIEASRSDARRASSKERVK